MQKSRALSELFSNRRRSLKAVVYDCEYSEDSVVTERRDSFEIWIFKRDDVICLTRISFCLSRGPVAAKALAGSTALWRYWQRGTLHVGENLFCCYLAWVGLESSDWNALDSVSIFLYCNSAIGVDLMDTIWSFCSRWEFVRLIGEL